MARNLLLTIVLIALPMLDVGEHRIVHFSDTHLPVAGSDTTFAKAREHVQGADAVVVTGDLTEFGGLDSLEKFDKVFATVTAPFVPTLGNHDATWRSLHDVFWKRFGKNYYAKDAGLFRVLALDSSTCQDPRPHWDPAQLAWIASEAAGASKWLVPAFHHPPWGGEFASPWARARLAVALGRAPVACMLTGHNHSSSTQKWGGMRVVVGGAAQGKGAGYTTIETRKKKLHGAYHPNEGEERSVFTDPLPAERTPLPDPETRIEGEHLLVRLEGGASLSTRAFVDVTGCDRVHFDGHGVARVPLAQLAPGPRGLAVSEGEHGRFAVAVAEIPGAKRRFRVEVGSGIRTRPVVLHGVLVVGTEGGELVALDPASGTERWRVATNGPVLGTPIALDDRIVFGSGDGALREISRAGVVEASWHLNVPLYSAPVVLQKDLIAVTDLDGTLYRGALENFAPAKLALAKGPVEAPPLVVSSMTVIQGAWDQKLHAVDAKTLKELWSVETDGPRAQRAKRYYSPADAPLAMSGHVLAACDRDSKLTLIDPATGERLGGQDDAWAVVACEGGFVVKGAKALRRIALDGTVKWTTAVRLGRTPAAPLVHRGLVWSCSDEGEACAVDLETGALVRRERVNPGELVLASPGAEGDLVYFASLDGSLTALDAGR